MRVLITGGAGFIGSHLADALIERGDEVTLLDCLDHQVHLSSEWPAWTNARCTMIRGDVRRACDVRFAMCEADVVVHLAARVGVGQSMYEWASYMDVNVMGTARLLEAAMARRIRKLVVASSMSIYGDSGPLPAREDAPLHPTSPYATSKLTQEQLCLQVGPSYGISTTALRFFNVYGPRQSLSNPYTGVAAMFASRLLCDQRPLVYEDGAQLRDFVHVRDVVQAILLAIDCPGVDGLALNVGSGEPVTILEVATLIAEALDSSLSPVVTGETRAGDARHCVGSIEAIRAFGYRPTVDFKISGARELAVWCREMCDYAEDRTHVARLALLQRGLLR